MADDRSETEDADGESQDPEWPVTEIEVSLRARSKTARYFSAAAIEDRLSNGTGTLFRGTGGTYYLKTQQTDQKKAPRPIVIVFEVEGETIQVVTQTADHYDWAEFDQTPHPPWTVIKNGD